MGFLTETVERVRQELERSPLPERTLLLRTRSAPPVRDLEEALQGPPVSIIAEVKRATPWAGLLSEVDAGEHAARCTSGGAAAVSLVTASRSFQGSLLDLRSARRRCEVPVLRRDFILYPVQVIEARAEGADAVWLMAAALTRSELGDLQAVAADLGMAALVEVHSEAALALARRAPGNRLLIMEGGLATRKQVVEAEGAGADAVVVGEALMRSPDPGRMIGRLSGRLSIVSDPGT
jgi:indole-3-glycerol phosphate synthase